MTRLRALGIHEGFRAGKKVLMFKAAGVSEARKEALRDNCKVIIKMSMETALKDRFSDYDTQ